MRSLFLSHLFKVMLATYIGAMIAVYFLAHYIVDHYGLAGTVITISVMFIGGVIYEKRKNQF